MLRDRILKTKRDELSTCITSRKRKLQELYNATVVFATEPNSHYDHKYGPQQSNTYSESEFLEASNIVKGRFFDIAILRRLPGGDSINHNDYPHFPTVALPSKSEKVATGSTSRTAPTKTNEDQSASVVNSLALHTQSSKEVDNWRIDLPSSVSVGIQAGGSFTRTDANNQNGHIAVDEGANHPISHISSLQPSKESKPSPEAVQTPGDVPVRLQTTDDEIVDTSRVETLQYGTDKTQETVEKSDRLAHTATHDQVQHQSKGSLPSQSEGMTRELKDLEEKSVDNRANLDNRADRDNKTANEDLHDQFLQEPRLILADSVTVKGTPSTPDEQLRLEEAQFMKPSQRFSYALREENNNLPVTSSTDKATGMAAGQGQGSQLCNDANDTTLFSRRKMPQKQDSRISGMTSDGSKDLMFSQRPPMRIDTGVPPANHDESARTEHPTDSRTPSAASTPLKPAPTPSQQSPPERMTTRVSSGALRHKSVSEILGETPKSATHQGDRSPSDKIASDSNRDESGYPTPRYGQLVASPDSLNFRSRLSELREREKERSKLSTVVFARQQPTEGSRSLQQSSGDASAQLASSDESKDYLVPLFTAQASAQQPPLSALMASARKTLTTQNQYLEFHEQQDCRILKRIYHLQNSNRWSLRQLERSMEPERPASHWDVLLDHMKWMRTDFREERKWKITVAKNLADWCAEWVSSPKTRRALLQVRIVDGKEKAHAAQNHATPVSLQNNGENLPSETTPELVPSAEDDYSESMDEESNFIALDRTVAPAAIFSLAPEDVCFTLDKTPISDKLLSELPIYEPWRDVHDLDSQSISLSLDSSWKSSIVPISKFAKGKMVIKEKGSTGKRSRYDYEDETVVEHDRWIQGRPGPNHNSEDPCPENQDVALFNPDNKHIISRLHAAHAFRPPSEFNMPSQSFFEARSSSQWTPAEDDELRKLVKDCAYNWSLISSCLASPSLFSSGAERRTPWECFERWVGFEGLPGEMSRTQYFRTWHARRDSARHSLNQQFAAQQQVNSGQQLQVRRRNTEPMRVERRRNSKHLALVHAMQKVAKKKETTIQKQQHVASLAAMRKATETTQPRGRMQTPQEFSRFKYERELKFQEKQEQYRAQMILQQKNAMAQQREAMLIASQHHAGTKNMQSGRSALPGTMNSNSSHLGSNIPSTSLPGGLANQARAIPPIQGIMNGGAPNVGHSPNSQIGARAGAVPQAPMQSFPQGQPRLPVQMTGNDSLRIFQEANRLQAEQQQYLQQQRQQRYPQSNGPNGLSTSPHIGSLNGQNQGNAALLGGLQNGNGNSSPSINGIAGTSRPAAPSGTSHSHQLSNGSIPLVNQISDTLRYRNPQASPEQIKQLTSNTLNRLQQQAQSIGAIGTANMVAANNNSNNNVNLTGAAHQPSATNYTSGMLNPQMYAQYMHSQQATQQDRNFARGVNSARPPSRDATPQMRHGSVQGGKSPSPRLPQAQVAGAP